MRITFDELADAVYLYLTDAPIAKSTIVEPDANYDFDEEGNIRGIEVRNANYWFGDLSKVTAETMLATYLLKAHGESSAKAA